MSTSACCEALFSSGVKLYSDEDRDRKGQALQVRLEAFCIYSGSSTQQPTGELIHTNKKTDHNTHNITGLAHGGSGEV